MEGNITLLGNASNPEKSNRFDIINCIFLITIGLAIVVGNSVIICAIRLHKTSVKHAVYTHNITFSLVISLAVTDIVVGLLCIPFRIYGFVSSNHPNDDVVCLLGLSTDIAACTSSIFHLLMLSVDRYFAICRPLYHRSLPHYMVHIAIAICWIIPILMVFPFTLTKLYVGNHIEGINICQPFDNATHYKIFSCMISFIIPSTCISVLYFRIYQVVKQNNSKPIGTFPDSFESDTFKERVHNETTAAKTIATILVCFFTCWSPFFIVYILTSYVKNEVPQFVTILVEWMAYSNSMMNPLLYFRCNKSINASIKKLFKMV